MACLMTSVIPKVVLCLLLSEQLIQGRKNLFPSWITSRRTKYNMGIFNSKLDEGDEDWKKEAHRLSQLFLDPWYHKVPTQKVTVEVAREYGEGISKFGGVWPGAHKYLGGAADDHDGCIYGIPSHARSLICLYPTKDQGYKVRIESLPEKIAHVKFKWLRGIIAHGYLYGIPAWADCVLEVDIDAMWGRREAKGEIINLIPLPVGHEHGKWQWHGAACNKEMTAIYCIPNCGYSKILRLAYRHDGYRIHHLY